MVEVFKPQDLAEALQNRLTHKAMPFAGGTDLMVRFRAKNGLPPSISSPVVFVHDLPQLRKVRLTDAYLEIGASVPMAVMADDPGARKHYAVMEEIGADALAAIPELLRRAGRDIGAPALRQRATMAGNVANASPAGDSVAALYALDAVVVLASPSSTREMPLSQFITGPGRTLLGEDELITAFRIPRPSPPWSYWRKVGTRRANALTKVSLAAAAGVEADRVTSFSLAFGAVAPTVVRSAQAEKALVGKTIDELASDPQKPIRAVEKVLQSLITPIDDQRSTSHYRKVVALRLARVAITNFISYLKETS